MVSVPISAGGAPQLLLGTDQGAFVSTDGTRFQATGGLNVSPVVNAFALAAAPGALSNTLFSATGHGVARLDVASLAGNANWAPSNGGASVSGGGSNLRLNNANIVDTAVMGATVYAAATTDTYAEVFSSADGGATWVATHIASALHAGETIIALAPDASRSVLYAATTQGLLAHQPGSGTWAAIGGAALTGRAAALALGSGSLFVGTDNGVVALPLNASPGSAAPVAAGLTGSSVRTLLVANGTVFAGTIDPADDRNYIFSAPEAGAASGRPVWSAFGVGDAGTRRVTSLALLDTRLVAATSGGLVLYASAGSAWASANTSTDPAQQISDAFGVVNSLYSDGSSVYAATGNNGVFVSPVGSFSWTPFSGTGDTALPSLEVHTLRAGGSTLYAATRGGVASLVGSITPPSPPASSPSGPGSGGGGGAIDPLFALLLLGGLIALAFSRRRA
jgi:hypothetical protein